MLALIEVIIQNVETLTGRPWLQPEATQLQRNLRIIRARSPHRVLPTCGIQLGSRSMPAVTYAYDREGSIMSRAEAGCPVITFVYDPRKRSFVHLAGFSIMTSYDVEGQKQIKWRSHPKHDQADAYSA